MLPTPRWKKTLYAAMAAEFLAIAGFSTTTPIMPFFVQELGVHDPVRISFFAGLLSTGPSLMLAVFAPIWGALADQVGRKPMLLRAMIGGTIIMFLQGLSPDPWTLVGLRSLQGCFTGTVAAATVLVASNVPREEAGPSLGALQMSIFLGNSFGPMFGGYISDHFGYRWNFRATSLLLLLAAIIVWRFVKDDFVKPERKKSILKSLVPDFSPLRKQKALWALLAVVAADQISGSIAAPFLPLFIQSITADKANVASMTGLVLGAGAIASAIAALTLGKLSARIGYRRTLVITMSCAALCILPMPFVTSPYQLLVLRVMSAFFIGGNMPSVNALIAERATAGKQGSVYGLSSSISSTSNALGPVIGSGIAAAAGYRSVFFATASILALAGTSIGLFVRNAKGKEEAEGRGDDTAEAEPSSPPGCPPGSD